MSKKLFVVILLELIARVAFAAPPQAPKPPQAPAANKEIQVVRPPQAPPVVTPEKAPAPKPAVKKTEAKKAASPQDAAVLVQCGQLGGSGTVVACENGKSCVVTNRHVVRPGPPGTPPYPPGTAVSVTTADGRVYNGVIAATCREWHDLAILAIDGELPVAELATEEVRPGTEVYQWGRTWYANGRPVPKRGVFRQVNQVVEGPIWESTITSESGDSGCGVFDASGRLVAVNWGAGNGEQSAVPIGPVRGFLREAGRALFPRLAARMDEKQAVRAAIDAEPSRRAAAGNAAIGWMSYEDGYAAAVASGKPVVVVFIDPKTCPPCRKYAAGALADPAVAEYLNGVVAIKVDVTTPAGAEWARKCNITSVPTTTFHAAAGQPSVDQASGELSSYDLVSRIQALKAKAANK